LKYTSAHSAQLSTLLFFKGDFSHIPVN